MSAKPFSTYPEDRERLLTLARLIQKVPMSLCDYERAADALSDLVIAILEDEAIALPAPAPEMHEALNASTAMLENISAYLRKHADSLPPASLSSLEVRIEKNRATLPSKQEA